MWDANRRADVVILTAIRLEYDAAKEVDAGAEAGSQWEEIDGPNSLPVAFREFTVANGRPLRIALAVSPDMGATAATNTLLPLVERLQLRRCAASVLAVEGRRTSVTWWPQSGSTITTLGSGSLTRSSGPDDAGAATGRSLLRDARSRTVRDEACLHARPLTAEWRGNRAARDAPRRERTVAGHRPHDGRTRMANGPRDACVSWSQEESVADTTR